MIVQRPWPILARATLAGSTILLALLILAVRVGAAEMTPAVALERLFREQPAQAAWFAPGFLAQVPIVQMQDILRALQVQYGTLQGIDPSGSGFTVRLERARVPAQIVLDAEGRVAGLYFQPPVPTGGVLDDYVATIAAVPGHTSILVLSDGQSRAAREADVPLAVASAFKLVVLKAVADRVAAGTLAWDTVVRLEPGWRSLPTGILQAWPDGTPLTIATLAGLMISMSDNTAADGLMQIVGRDALEALSPRNRPFLTTRELFVLKSADGEDLRRAWRAGDEAARRALLAQVDALPLPDLSTLWPSAILDIDWLLTPDELCALLEPLHELPVFRISPGVADAGAWDSVAFKGGSEIGVLNLSTYLAARDGSRHCVVATWNGEGMLDQGAFTTAYRGLLQMLAKP
jgi:hypothetical protein